MVIIAFAIWLISAINRRGEPSPSDVSTEQSSPPPQVSTGQSPPAPAATAPSSTQPSSTEPSGSNNGETKSSSSNSPQSSSSTTAGDSLPRGLGAKMADTYRKALAGDSAAMVALGYAYQTGEGAKRDNNQAVAWYRKAAEAGNATGMTNFGIHVQKRPWREAGLRPSSSLVSQRG